MHLFGASVTSFCLSFSFLWASNSIKSSLVSSCVAQQEAQCYKNDRCLPFSLLTPLFQLFSLYLHCYFLVLLSSTIYIISAFTFASGHPGLEKKRLYYCTLYSTVRNTEAQSLVKDEHTWQCMPDTWTNLSDWTWVLLFTSLKVHNLKVHM